MKDPSKRTKDFELTTSKMPSSPILMTSVRRTPKKFTLSRVRRELFPTNTSRQQLHQQIQQWLQDSSKKQVEQFCVDLLDSPHSP